MDGCYNRRFCVNLVDSYHDQGEKLSPVQMHRKLLNKPYVCYVTQFVL